MKKVNLNKNKEEVSKSLIRTIDCPVVEEFIEKKSKFIASAFPIETSSEALQKIDKVRKQYSDANHNCFAYVLGLEKNIYKFSDDGEPAGTAGKPILQTILNFNITNVLVVVSRYFGGIKLGASGLVRAYSKAAKLVLEKAKVIEVPICEPISLELDYTDYVKAKSIIYLYIDRISENFDNNVRIEGIIPVDLKEDFLKRINDALSKDITKDLEEV
jgi:uncharacterized YigZ family protein